MASKASAFTWVWGNPGTQATTSENPRVPGSFNNVVNGTGAGAAFNTHKHGELFTYHIETNDSGWGYELRVGRTSSGPWRTISSNSGTSTATLDIRQFPGPFAWLSPNVSALASTANYVIISMVAVEG